MLLLALDTATPAVTVALHDGERALATAEEVDPRRHGELLLPAVDRVLTTAGRRLADVTALVVGTGPGPYTGLRVGLATAAALGVTGLVVTKLDGTAKGGVLAAIAMWSRERLWKAERRVPVYFIGVGEKLEDLQTFNAREFAQALLA